MKLSLFSQSRWQSALSKPLLALFVVQLLVSAMCISSANAAPVPGMNDPMKAMTQMSPMQPAMTKHCHSDKISSHHHSSNGMTGQACTHCNTPSFALSDATFVSPDMTAILLAVIVLPEYPALQTSSHHRFGDAHRIPIQRSSSLLFSTTQRIRV